MGDALQSLVRAIENSPMGPVPTALLGGLFLAAALYMTFSKNQGRGTPVVRLVGVLMLVVAGYILFTSLGLRRPF